SSRPFPASRLFHLVLRPVQGDRNYRRQSGRADPLSALPFAANSRPYGSCFYPVLVPSAPPYSQLTLGVAPFHASRFVYGRLVSIMPEDMLSDGLVHGAQLIR